MGLLPMKLLLSSFLSPDDQTRMMKLVQCVVPSCSLRPSVFLAAKAIDELVGIAKPGPTPLSKTQLTFLGLLETGMPSLTGSNTLVFTMPIRPVYLSNPLV